MKLESLSKLILCFIIFSIFIPISTADRGNVWAQHQDLSYGDIFYVGELVYIEGQNLGDTVPFTWEITNQDDPANDFSKPVLASGSGTTLSGGAIGHLDTGYIIPSGVPINHKLRVTIHPTGEVSEADFIKKDSFESIPEFPTIALPIAAILGLMFILQSRRKKED